MLYHPASLVHPSSHSPAVLELVDMKISRPVLDYVVDCVVDTVDYAMNRPSTSRGRSAKRQTLESQFALFVDNVITRAEVSMATLLSTLVYIDRAKPHLHIALEEWALERVFLGALMTASKYTNDSTLRNVHWAMCTGVFGKRDVGRIEREFLEVLDWELSISEDAILAHHPFLSALNAPPRRLVQFHDQKRHATARPHHHHHHQPSSGSSHHSHLTVPELAPSSPMSASSTLTSSDDDVLTPEFEEPSFAPVKSASKPIPVPQKQRSREFTLPSVAEIINAFPIPFSQHTRHMPAQHAVAA